MGCVMFSAELPLQRGTLSYIKLAEAERRRHDLQSAPDTGDYDSDDDVALDEDLSHLLDEYALVQRADEAESPGTVGNG